jgi:hypothetical protein
MLFALLSSNLAPPGWRPPAFYADRAADEPLSSSEIYVVERGDTLKSIAAALFGDAQRWYWLAEANGLEGADPLACGQRLIVPHCVPAWHTPISIKPRLREFGGAVQCRPGNLVFKGLLRLEKTEICGGLEVGIAIPNKVANIHNNSTTFAVYNAGEAIGDTSPTLPEAPPPPAPPKGGCGGVGQIIMIIVAIVASMFMPGLLGVVLGNIIGQGI